MIGNVKGFGDLEFSIKQTKFRIVKLPPMQAFQLAESIREQLAHTAESFNSDGSEDQNITLFFKTILGLPAPFVKSLMDALFTCVEFSGNGVDRKTAKLAGMEDMAFQEFEIAEIYEVLGRCLFVNFSGSFSVIKSRFPGISQIINQQKPKI